MLNAAQAQAGTFHGRVVFAPVVRGEPDVMKNPIEHHEEQVAEALEKAEGGIGWLGVLVLVVVGGALTVAFFTATGASLG